jgi:fructose 1,6-bisphosphatase
MNTTEIVYDYEVKFIGDDVSLTITITKDRDDYDHNEIIVKAEHELCKLWGVEEIPSAYSIVNVDVMEVSV